MSKRLAIYCTYDREGIIDDYIVFCIDALKKADVCVAIVSNHFLSKKMKEKIRRADYIFERQDLGFDAGGIADCLCNFIGWSTVERYNEVIFMNDSIFGPLFDLQEMFDKMDRRKDLDFWGITKRAESDFDGGNVIYPSHIQLYFYVVRANMVKSRGFKEYWESILDKIVDFRSAIVNYEFGFTKYFEGIGFRWGVYIEDKEFDTQYPKINLSPYHYDMYRLITQWRCPFIKRKLFTGDFIFLEDSDRSIVKSAFDWIQQNSLYDINMIWSHILRIYYLQDIISGLQMYELFATKTNKDDLNNFYKHEHRICYWDKEGTYLGSHYKRDGFAFISVLTKQDTISYSLIEAKKRLIETNLLSDEQGIMRIIEFFQKEARLGVMVPPPYTYGKITTELMNRWSEENEAKKLYKKMSLTVPFDPIYAPIHYVDALWCRAELLSEDIISLIQNEASISILQMIPLIAQEKGFYTKILMNIQYVCIYMENMRGIVRSLLQNMGKSDLSLKEVEDQMRGGDLNQFCKKYLYIYIYGAGEKAVRAYHIIKDKGNVKGFIVSNYEGNPTILEGLPVISVNELIIDINDIGIVSTVGIRNRIQIKNSLLKKGIQDIYWI